jgi:hypothetical protein
MAAMVLIFKICNNLKDTANNGFNDNKFNKTSSAPSEMRMGEDGLDGPDKSKINY